MSSLAAFYAFAAAGQLAAWLVQSWRVGGDANRRALACDLAVAPSWLPSGWLARAHRALRQSAAGLRPALVEGLPRLARPLLRVEMFTWLFCARALSMMCGFAMPEVLGVRLAAALVQSAWALAESSLTCCHYDHLTMYFCWVMVAGSAHVRNELALAAFVHYVMATGVAKARIAGPCGWASAGLPAILERHSADAVLPQWLLAQLPSGLVRLLGFAVLFVECACPLILVAFRCGAEASEEEFARVLVVLAVLGLHVGIALFLSLIIGARMALGCLGPYAYVLIASGAATSARLRFLSLVGVAPCVWQICVGLLPEDWPCSNFALFAWSGAQWQCLWKSFEQGDVRLVISTAELRHPESLLGRHIGSKFGPKLPRGDFDDGDSATWREAPTRAPSEASGDEAGPAAFDAWETLVGRTIVHPGVLPIIEDYASARASQAECARRIQEWLRSDTTPTMVEIGSGEACRFCYFVKVQRCGDVDAESLGDSASTTPLLLAGLDRRVVEVLSP